METPGPTKTLLLIAYAVLMALLALSAWAASWPISPAWKLVVALTIAAAKTSLIFLIFMQLWYRCGLIRVFACAGFLWLAIAGILTFTDYFTRNWKM